jgi:hypothetical protein
MESIESRNDKRQWHGYQELYYDGKLWCIGNYKNNSAIGYHVYNVKLNCGIGDEGTQVDFYII